MAPQSLGFRVNEEQERHWFGLSLFQILRERVQIHLFMVDVYGSIYSLENIFILLTSSVYQEPLKLWGAPLFSEST